MVKEFEEAVKKMVPVAVDAAKVGKVNGDTCEVRSLTGKGSFYKCSLNAVRENGENKVLLTPKEGSTVIIGILKGRHNHDAVILQVCDLEKIYLKLGATTLEVDENGYKLNGENFGGVVKAPELEEQLAKMTARIDGIIDAINNGTPAAGASDGGSALHSSIKAGLGAIGQKEDFAEIRNETIKHGDGQ